MPTFIEGKKRNPWKGQVRRKGFKPEARYFATEPEAKAWEDKRRDTWDRQSRGELVSDPNDLRNVTVGDMIDTYIKKETSKKASCVDETYRLDIFRNWNKIKDRPVIAFTKYDAEDFKDYLETEYKWTGKTYTVRSGRLKGKVITPNRKATSLKPGSIERIIAILKDMWNIAASKWRGYDSLQGRNPWVGVKPTGKAKKRTRRLDDLSTRENELERLLEATKRCSGQNKIYLPLGINLAVQTGMRLQEIMNLRWNDIDVEQMTINIRKSKTDYKSDDDGRVISLPTWTYMYLDTLIRRINGGDYLDNPPRLQFEKNEPIFLMTSDAFEQAWKRVTRYAKIPSKEQDKANGIRESQCGLEFKDLRREAGSRFDDAGLTKLEHDLMMGHASREMRGIYVAPYLKRIREKLDEFWWDTLKRGGLSFAENGTYTVTPYDKLRGMPIRSIDDVPDTLRKRMTTEALEELTKLLIEHGGQRI
jgi:integrase